MLWLTRMMVLPSALSRRIRSSTCAVSFTPSAAVGSSITISSAFQRSAREIATACRCPPDRFSTAMSMSAIVTPSRAM